MSFDSIIVTTIHNLVLQNAYADFLP